MLVSLLALLALIAAACGGDDDAASGSDGTEATDGTTDDGTDGTGDAGDSSDSAGEGDSAADSGDTDSGAADAMEPEYGGAIVVGLEGETGQGWNPATSQFAVSGHVVARAIFDPLTVEMPDGTVAPFLLESFTPSADFTEWTLTMRPGIVFHDDTPADGEALARHFEEVRKSTLLGSILRPLDTVTVVDDLSVSLTFTRPVADFPGWLTGQIGYLTAPSQYDDDESASNPVGTGPFTFVEWIPDTKLVVEKNPNYWRTDGEGRELPFLDSIEFRPIPDSATRKLALDSGDLDASIDNEAQDFADYQADYELTVEGEGYHNTSYLLLNTSKPPFDDVRVRRAVAMCTDRDLYNTLRWGVGDVASGPFSPGTPGYLEDAGFPAFDPDGGRDLLAEVGSLGTITLGTTNDNFNRDSTELIASMWGDCGIDVQIKQVDQGELITLAVTGDFEAFLWRNHNGFSLGLERVWWHSDYASGLALNFGRIQDATIDAALDVALTDPDPAAVQAAAEDINRAFGEQVYNIWFYWSNWLVAYGPELHDVGAITTPEGTPALPMIEGRVFFTEAWMSAG
ncbi:MAG: ABC transporter substrate-binding protein [Acidimicrobiales bacterium]|nr:ABC transporter substrate-binding protein [Acidimicrobiales bacterium]